MLRGNSKIDNLMVEKDRSDIYIYDPTTATVTQAYWAGILYISDEDVRCK